MILRDYQTRMVDGIRGAWAQGSKNVLAALPTGGGKTVIFAHILAQETGPAIAIAHRQELVAQISLALARFGVRHGIIAPREIIREIVTLHHQETGSNWIAPNGLIQVAGVDTLIARMDKLATICRRVGLWVMDEAHHILRENKWGRALVLFPHARGLGVTATPGRADGRGLGRHAQGVMDDLIYGIPMAELQSKGYLTRYKIFAPASDLDLSGLEVSSATGDFVPKQIADRVRRSHITGDVVDHYLKLTPGRLGVTFAPTIESAAEIALKFTAAGVPAELVTAKTPTRLRAEIMRKFRAREILQVVNVDLFGEGFDLPALEVVSMARPTQSYPLYCQQFGRALRPMEGKSHAIILDHVGNVIRHGLPDNGRTWTLDSRTRRKGERDPDLIPITVCPQCAGTYERILKACPYCGHVKPPAARSGPDQVDGDLTELDPAALDRLQNRVAEIDRSQCEAGAALSRHLSGAPLAGALKQHEARREAQIKLRGSIALWGAWRRHLGEDDPMAYRRFYFKYGTDVLTAQTLGRPEAETLTAALEADMAGKVVRV
jgi:superfamily II DNA or RNA helicase